MADFNDSSTHFAQASATWTGPARVGRSIRDLADRARPGDVLVIDALDLREADAQTLIASRPVAVVNARRTVSGRQPAAGARRLMDAGVIVVDGAGSAVLAVRDGVVLTIVDGAVQRDGETIAEGIELTDERIVAADTAALDHLKVQVAVFGSHALERLEREGSLFFEGKGLPSLGADVAGKVVLIVADTEPAAEDLTSLRRFIRERKPLVVAEGGAVQRCIDAGLKPVVIVGGVDRAPEAALTRAHVIVAREDASAMTRLEALGASYEVSEVSLTGTDLAALVAHHANAEVVVVAGHRAAAVDVLSADPDTGIGAFLVALVTRRTTADASVVASTYRHRHSGAFVWTVLLLAFATLAVAVWSSPDVSGLIDDLREPITGLFGGNS